MGFLRGWSESALFSAFIKDLQKVLYCEISKSAANAELLGAGKNQADMY